MHVNLDYLISMHPTKAILLTFSGQTQHFLGKKQKNRPNNLHHQKAGFVGLFLKPKIEGSYFLHYGGRQIYTVSCKASYRNFRPHSS